VLLLKNGLAREAGTRQNGVDSMGKQAEESRSKLRAREKGEGAGSQGATGWVTRRVGWS
jgi:hypothetical protein